MPSALPWAACYLAPCWRPPGRPAARPPAEAMDYSDAWVRAGRDPGDPLLARERRALVASFSALRDAVNRQQLA